MNLISGISTNNQERPLQVTADGCLRISGDLSVNLDSLIIDSVAMQDSNGDPIIANAGKLLVDGSGVTQPVSGPLTDAQLRALPVPVSGNLALSGAVSVSNFPATQPISAASLPLPSGASTEATLALIKAKTDNIDVLLSTRTKPADTQTVSGTVSVSNFPATQPISGAVSISGTVPISAVALPLPSGASTEATLALIKAKTDNLDVLLSTRTKPTDTQVISGAVSVSNFPASQSVTGAFWQATQPVSGPLTDAQLRATAVPVNVPILTKGVQGANGISVQNLKDSGRTYISFIANAATGVTAEALVSFTQNKQGVTSSSVTSYVIPNGKTLRITSISISVKSAAAAIAFAKVTLRHNTAGATIVTSPIAYLCPEINTNSATSGTSAYITIPIPDGLEFFGNGTQTIGVSHLDQATTNVLNITINGFEY